MIYREEITQYYRFLQDELCQGLEVLDGHARFEEDLWERSEGGGGRTRILQNGQLIERGGVNFSAVHGHQLPKLFKHRQVSGDFFATGVSTVIHPINPWVPIIHMNVRYFELVPVGNGTASVRWFGGGMDLTPHYILEDDVRFFHTQLKRVCDRYDITFYPRFCRWADRYFFIKHRQETRGVGGIFYDRLTAEVNLSWEQLFGFSRDLGETFLPIYTELVKRNRDKPYTETHRRWQYQRRGRYVEFNLIYDLGTKFGLETHGKTESILMSLPPQASWLPSFQVAPDSEEAKTLRLLRKGVNWI